MIYADLATEAVLSIDDDIIVSCDVLRRTLEVSAQLCWNCQYLPVLHFCI
jgi:hypothetical protein